MKNTNTLTDAANYMLDSYHLFYSLYNNKGELEYTNATIPMFNVFFERTEIIPYVLQEHPNYQLPLVLNNQAGFLWTIVFESDANGLTCFHVFGPYLSKDANFYTLTTEILSKVQVNPRFVDKLRNYVLQIPNIQISSFYQQILFVNYTLNNVVLKVTDFIIKRSGGLPSPEKKSYKTDLIKENSADALSYYNAERKVLLNLETGNLNYEDDYKRYESFIRKNDKIKNIDYYSPLVFIALCVRSAIQGGMNAHKAYKFGSKYNSLLTQSPTSATNRDLIREFYHALMEQVSTAKLLPGYSKVTQSTIDYISANIEQKLTLEELAKRVGYTDYYLSRKFKNEVGESVNHFIKRLKMDRAKTLLETTNMTVTQISYQLGFESRSHFVNIFNEIVGQSPDSYRKNKKSF